MSPLRLTVIVEWENVLLAEMWRSKAMLVALREQCGLLLQGDQEGEGVRERNAFLDRFVSPVELLVVYLHEAPVVAVLILVYVATRALAIIATHARPEMMRAPRFRV